MPKDALKIVDQRTSADYEVQLYKGAIPAKDLRQIKTGPEDFGLMTYDPGFMNTASCHSAITYVDGAKGIMRYRGYPIEQLAEKCSFLEVAYLIVHGELPDEQQMKTWVERITHHTMLHETTKKFLEGFRYNAHPMGMFISTVAALSTVYPESRDVHDPEKRMLQIYRLIGKVPTIAAYTYRHSRGLPYVYPNDELGYCENFMNMLWKMAEPQYHSNPALSRALDILFILHADHEQNCSANVMRAVGSSHADPYVSIAAAAAALSGPLHGGANEEVVKMLDEIGSKDRVSAYIAQVKAGHGKLMGFGHRIYKSQDPRSSIIKWAAEQVFATTGKNPKLEIALELERIASEDEYFIKRKLYPNVEFYSGIIYQALGFNPDLYTVLFAIPRTVGWLSQWKEMMEDPEHKIARPRQIYTGHAERSFVPMEKRAGTTVAAER
jgi:citrate synthase